MIYVEFIGVFIVGVAAGFALGVWYLRRQLQNTQMDEKQVLAMARSMGVNLNQKQLQTVMRHMKQNPPTGKGPLGALVKNKPQPSGQASKEKSKTGKRRTK
ncbi:MAG TPA: YneF family protein [Alicyclobacillus sp.]|nr:YneF family protein [Alicyclobacillus sp.]